MPTPPPLTPAASNDPPSPSARHAGLDALRGLAVLFVLFNHMDADCLPGARAITGVAGWWYWHVHQLGWSGVELFFVLSGYLVGGLLFHDSERHGGIRYGRFFARRAFKILPSYWVLLAALAVTGATGFPRAGLIGASGRVGGLLAHLFFVHNYVDPVTNGPTWSLAVEEHFYLLLPIALGLILRFSPKERRTRNVVAMTSAVVAASLAARTLRVLDGAPLETAYMRSHFRFDALFLGVMVQCLVRSRAPIVAAILARPRIALFVALALIAPASAHARGDASMFTVGFLGLSIGYALLVTLVVGGGLLANPSGAAMRALAMVGAWSYNIYLWQFFLVRLPLPGYRAALLSIAAHVRSPGVALIAQGTVFVVTSVAIGALATKLVEAPMLRLRDRLSTPRPAARGVVAPPIDVVAPVAAR